jgi:hypothetical protein
MNSVREECARLASTASGRAALASAARFDDDPWLRLHAAVAVGSWDTASSADALTTLIVNAGGTVLRPMTLTVALAVRDEIGKSAALCLLNLDRGQHLDLSELPAVTEPGPAVPSSDLDAAEAVHNVTMGSGLDRAYEFVGPQFPVAAAAFDALGAPEAAQVLRAAVRLFGSEDVPAGRQQRAALVTALTPDAQDQLASLNGQFWAMHDLMDRLEAATEA